MSFPLLRQGDPVNRMAAEFNAIVTASFDDIGSSVALDNIHPLSPAIHSSSSSSSEKNPTRRSAASFFRKVKSHATSLLASQQSRLDAAAAPSPPARSFVPSLPAGPSYPPTSTPLPPRTPLTHALGKKPHTPDPPDLEPIRSFFDHDDDDHCVDRWVCPPPKRRIASASARSNSRLSSVFASAPVIFGLSSPSVSTTHLITERCDVVRTVSRADPDHEISKAPLRLRLRKKLSLPKIASRSHYSSPSSDPSPVMPSYHSHPYSAFSADIEHSHLCREFFGDRSITPEEDPFRKDEVSPHLLPNSRLPSSSRSGSFDSDSETYHQIPGSHTIPVLSSRWSSDSDSPPSSPSHARGRLGRGPGPSQNVSRVSSSLLQGPNRPPLSLTFPLPPSAQKSVPLPGVTVRVTTPKPAPPPAYPPPPSPPPSGPLPCPPPVDAIISSVPLPSARLQESVSKSHPREDFEEIILKSKPTPTMKTRRRRSYLDMDKPPVSFPPRNMAARSPPEGRSNAAKSKQQKSGTRRRGRPLTPYPLLFPTGRMEQDTTGRLEASKAVTRYSGPGNDSAFDQRADAIPDSEVEPDREFDSDKARKKTSFSSATSAQTTESSTSTTSVSTTTSFVSIDTSTTAATTVSPSTSPPMSAIKPHHVSQVLVADEEGGVVGTTTYSTPSSRPITPPVDSNVQSSGIYIKQGGTMRDTQSDLFLAHGEQVMIGASGWTEFCNHCDNCRAIALFLAGNHYGNSVVDVSVVEFQRGGKMCGFELRIIARTSGPQTSADFPGHIPGTYPLSSNPSSLLPDIPRIPPIDISQSSWSKWMESALGLEGVPPAQDAGRPTSPTPLCSGSRLGSPLDWVHEGGTRHRTVLAFTAALPTTLRDLAKCAGEMSLLDGVAIP